MADMKRRYEELYNNMASSKDVTKMIIFGNAEKWVFGELMVHNPRLAERWLEKLEASQWHNYLTHDEAKRIVSGLINQDGSNGGKWSRELFLQTVDKLGGATSKEPYYNDNALWVTANMIYSDHAKSIAEDMGVSSPAAVPADKMALSCYRKAVEKLTDKDRERFIRDYFDEELSDD